MLNTKILWILSILFIASVGMRFNISILSWIMFVPLLLLIREVKTTKSWFFILGLIQIAYFLQISKIITDPMPIMMASLPSKRVWTLYHVVGDIFPYMLILFLLFIGIKFCLKKS